MSSNNKASTLKRPRCDSPEPHPITRGKSPFLAAEYLGQQVAVLRNSSYKETINSIKKAFKGLRDSRIQDVQLYLKVEGVVNPVLIVEELWADLVPSLSLIKVVYDAPPKPIAPITKSRITVRVVLDRNAALTCRLSPRTKLDRLKKTIRNSLFAGSPDAMFKLMLSSTGDYLFDGTLAENEVEDGDEITVLPRLTGGKPVIYLFSPAPILGVRVQLSLVKAWRFSAIYPPTPIELPSDDSFSEIINWTVDTQHDGSLFDQLTNREVAYLFWEAHTNPKLPTSISPPATPSAELGAFDPACPMILPANSALLPFEKVTGYIDDALLAMELHAEARTSFITYWLPSLSKHSHIALRFLPQDQYETSAPLQVTPVPEVTTRVFMLFTGVQESDLGVWKAAQVPAEEWSSIVGVDRAKAEDASLFRVLEWGGMEVR